MSTEVHRITSFAVVSAAGKPPSRAALEKWLSNAGFNPKKRTKEYVQYYNSVLGTTLNLKADLSWEDADGDSGNAAELYDYLSSIVPGR